MQLRHYSKDRITSVNPIQESQLLAEKPRGFWVSDDSDAENNWLEWCRTESFRLDHCTHVHDLTLADDANILVLRSSFEIDALTTQYGQEPSWAKRAGYSRPYIDWPSVALKYQGIVITPYILARRLEGGSPWYYGWDCASGCIWDHKAIKSIVLSAVVDVSAMKECA